MNRADRIWNHAAYRSCYELLTEAERDRIFCGHDLRHFLDVARIMRILAQESGISIDTDLIYAAALLHDIGRARQYRDGTPHETAGADLAEEIMKDCGYSDEETALVAGAIRDHRKAPSENAAGSSETFSELLYRADKLSRSCFACPAAEECNWPTEKRNKGFLY